MWAIRAGVKGEADELFLSGSSILLSDPGIGDLTKLAASREAFYAAYRSLRPNETPTGTAGVGGKFFRFVHEIEERDIVLYPRIRDRSVHIAEVESGYLFDPKRSEKFPHSRVVRWIHRIWKDDLSESARRELGAARTLFEFKTNGEEIRAILARFGNIRFGVK